MYTFLIVRRTDKLYQAVDVASEAVAPPSGSWNYFYTAPDDPDEWMRGRIPDVWISFFSHRQRTDANRGIQELTFQSFDLEMNGPAFAEILRNRVLNHSPFQLSVPWDPASLFDPIMGPEVLDLVRSMFELPLADGSNTSLRRYSLVPLLDTWHDGIRWNETVPHVRTGSQADFCASLDSFSA